MKYFKKYITRYMGLFILGIILVASEAICDLLQPTILANLIDIGIKNNDINYVLNKGILMIGITLIGSIFAVTRSIISTNVSQRFARDLRSDLFIKINSYSLENIDYLKRASLITRSTNDVNQIQQFVNGMMRIIIKAPILCIGSLILAMKMNLKLSLILLILICIIFIIILVNLKIGAPYFKSVQISLDKVNSNLREYLNGVRVVKLFNKSDYEEERFDEVNSELLNKTVKAMKISSIFRPTITLVVNIGIVLILYIGSNLVMEDQLEIGIIVAYINYIGRILTSLLMISHIFNVFIRAKASSERINEVFELHNDIDSSGKLNICINGDLEFKNVTFSYKENNSILKNISFKVKKGEHIGIIGSTGSGKTSLVNLIPRFYNVNKGCIKIDNIDIRKISSKNIRNYISIVSQKSVLFNGTILENIKMGNDKATIEEINQVCELSDSVEFINGFEKLYDQQIGEGGVNLSGGQKQRLCIARALIKNPKILILDDSFSAMDINTENKIKNNIKMNLKDSTCLIVSQKISSIIDLDKIIVLDYGKIVGFDSHENLINNCKTYNDIYKSQFPKD